jgi:hypothetical protein
VAAAETTCSKTQCAVEYCHLRLTERRGPVIWIDARTVATRKQNTQEIQKVLSLPKSHKIQNWLDELPTGLLVLDNVVDIDEVINDLWWLKTQVSKKLRCSHYDAELKDRRH